MLFINFVCLFYLMVLVASHTISKSIDISNLLDDALDSIDDHQLQKHPRRDKESKRHLFWWRKSSVLKEKPNKSKSTTRTAKEVNNAKIKTNKQIEMEQIGKTEKKAKKIGKTKRPRPIDDDWQMEADKSNVTSSSKYVKITTNKQISISPKEAEKVPSKEKKKKKHKSKHTHRTRARGDSDDQREKHRRQLPVTNPAGSYLAAARPASFHNTDHTLSHYYKMLVEMSTKLDNLMRLYSKSYGLDSNRPFTLPSLQIFKQHNDRFTGSLKNRVLAPDNFEGTDMLEPLLSEIKFRTIEVIAKQTPALSDLITNTVITTTFAADPMLTHYDPIHPKVMQMDLEGAAPTLAASTKDLNKNPVMNTVKSLKKGLYNDDGANYFVVQPSGTRRDRAADDPPSPSLSKDLGTTVGEQIGKKLKDIFNKVKQSVESVKGHKVDNAAEWDDKKKHSLEKPVSPNDKSTKSKSMNLNAKVNQVIPTTTTCLIPTNKILVYTKLTTGKHRKGNVYSTKKHSSKHKKNRRTTKHNISTTPMTVATEDEDYAVLSLVEQMLSKEERLNVAHLLSTINPKIKRHYRRAVTDSEAGSITNIVFDDISTNYEHDTTTETPIDETSYEGLTKKISYNDFVEGYKHYLKFEKDMGHSNFSNMVRYQAHRHHDVDDIGKFILDKIPQIPTLRYKRDFFDYDDDDQDISTKSEESWFKKHLYYLADRSVQPKKFHTSQLVPLKLPLAARDGMTWNPYTKFMTKKSKPKLLRTESHFADGESIDDLEELAWMLKRSSLASTTLVPGIANTAQNAGHDAISVRSSRLFNKMFCGIKNPAKKSPRKHTVKKHNKKPVEDARLKRMKRHEVNKKLMSKLNYVQRDEAEPTKCTVPTNLFDQVAAEEQQTKEKRDRIETINATTDRAIEEGKGKRKIGYVNVELVPATTVGTLRKIKERGRFAKFMHNFRFRMKKPEKRQKRAVTRKQRCGLFRKLKQIFSNKPKTNKEQHYQKQEKNTHTVTRKISAYNPVNYVKNLNDIKYELPSISDDIRNKDYSDVTTAGRIISAPQLVDFWATKEPLKAPEPAPSREHQLDEARKFNNPGRFRIATPLRRNQPPATTKRKTPCAPKLTPENEKYNAEKLDEIRKEIENIEVKTSSPFDLSYDPVGRTLKEFEEELKKGYLPGEMTQSKVLNSRVFLTGQSEHTTPQTNKMNDDAYTFAKNNAIYEHHVAALGNSVNGIINNIYKKSHTKADLGDFPLKPQYKDKTAGVPAVTNFMKENYFFDPQATTHDDFNDLIIWNSDILHSDSVLKSSMPPVKAVSIKDDFAEFLKGNQLYAEHTFSKKVQVADQYKKDRHLLSKGGKKARAIKYKSRKARGNWDFRRDLTYDNIVKRLDALLSKTSSTERYDRMSTEKYDKVMSYEALNLRDVLTETTTLPYEKDVDYLRDGMKITKNAFSPEVRAFKLSTKNKTKMALPQQFHATPLPMEHKEFDDFLKLNDIDVESVTAFESNGTKTIANPIQMAKTEDPYISGNSKSSKNHVDKSRQISKELLKHIYGFEDGLQKSLKMRTKHRRKPSKEEGALTPNILKGIQNRRNEVTVDDYDDQSELPQLIPESNFPCHEKNQETTEPDLKPDLKPDDEPDLQEHIRFQEDMKEKITTIKKPGKKFNDGCSYKHNKLFFGKDEEVSTQPVLEPTKSKGKPARISPPKRIIIKGHSYKYDIVYGDGDEPGGMLHDRDRPAGTHNALVDLEEPAQEDPEQVYDQLNTPKVKEPVQERTEDKKNVARFFSTRTTEDGMVSVKDTYHFLNSLLRQHTRGATVSEPDALPAGTLDFHNYFNVGVQDALESKDKLQRKRKEKRKGKREAGEESFTAKNVAEIEVIVDLIKNPEAFEESSRLSHSQNTTSTVLNKEVKPVNSIQVHIGVPRYGAECHSAKRSLQNIKKVFIAKMCTPVDLEYQVKSYVIPPSTVVPTGVYLLLDNNDSSDGNLVLKPIFHNINVAVVKPREITAVPKDYSTEKITTTQTLSKLNKVTLTRDFVAAVNKHLMQLCELLSINDTHHVHVRAANQEKPRRSLSWRKLKKYLRGEHVCDCKCKINSTMCKSCAATDKVMTDLIFEIDGLIKFMNDHCTEIQTYFYNNPSGGKKLKDSVKSLDRNLQNYYKRVKGKCQGKSCEGFRFLDKRFFYSTPKYKYTDLLNYFPYGINSPIMEGTTLSENSRNDVFIDRNINTIDKPDESDRTETTTETKKKARLKTVYSLDNVNVNIICKDSNVTTTQVPPRQDYGGQVSNTPFTEPILVRFENKLRKDLRHSNKYNKREVEQIDSPLNADSSGSFWNDYFNKVNESALIFVATGMIPDTGTSKVINERDVTTVENINLPIENASHLTTLHETNYNETTGNLQTRSATLSYESISTEAPSTDEPLQDNFNELIKLLEDVYVKDFNEITMKIHTVTKKPVVTIKTTVSKNCTCHKEIKEKCKCKCMEKVTAVTDTSTNSTLTDSILLNNTTTDTLLNNTTTEDTTDNILIDHTELLKFVPNISDKVTDYWRSSTKESNNIFPYLKKLKDATLGWFNYDKSKEGLDIDNLAPVTHEKDQLFKVMQVLGIKNKKEAYTTNHAESQGTVKDNPTILIFNDDEEPYIRSYSKDNHVPDVDNSSGIDVLDIHSTVDSYKKILLSLLKYESQKLAKEWKRYAGRNHNATSSVDDEPKKEEPEDNMMMVMVEAMNNTEDSITDQESSRAYNATRKKEIQQQKDQDKQCEEVNKELRNEKEIENEMQKEMEIKKEVQEEKEIEKQILKEKQLILWKEKEIAKEKRKKERYTEKLRKLKEKERKMAQTEKNKLKKKEESRIQEQKVKENEDKKKCHKQCKEEKKVKEKKKQGNQMPKSMYKNAEPGKQLPSQTLVTEKVIKINETSKSTVENILDPLRKLELPAPPPGKEGFIYRLLNKFNVSWCTSPKNQEETIQLIERWPSTETTEANPMGSNDYYDSDAIMSVSLITGDKGEIATERRSIVEPMDAQKSDDGSDQPRRLCDLQDTFSYALRCLQQDKKWFQDYAKRIPCHRYMITPKCFCIAPGKHNRGKIAVFKEPKRKLRWDWKRNKRSLYVEEVEDDPLKDDKELLDGDTHSLRDDLISNDGFERMYKDEFGIYRIETRKKRSSVDAEAVIQGLKDLAPIKVPKNEIYAMPRDSVTISCTLDASKGPIYWSLNEGPIPDNAVAKGTHLAIQNVKTDNSGNYTCFQCRQSGALSAGKRERWTQLTVVRLPVFRIVTFLLYRCRPLCSANEVGALRELGDHMTKAACPGNSCTVQVHRPTGLEDQTNHSSLASVFVDVAPTRRAARCGVECARNMYCSLTRLIADNAATIATIPVIVSWKVRNTTLTPLVRQNIFVTQTSNIQQTNPLHTQAKWTSGELDVKMYCPVGFYLVPDMKLCVTNPMRYLPAMPRRVRRYDWWRPSYLYLFACVVVGALCACAANALTRGEGAAEGARGNRVTARPCVEVTGGRRISPSRVILPRLFRHASSRISQETKLDMKKNRLPPPLPPVDFDP